MILGFNANEIFQIAVDIEENGRSFYERAQGVIDDSAVKELFSSLERQEVAHKQRFLSLKDRLPESAKEGTVFDPDNDNDRYLKMTADMNVFSASADMDEKLAGVRSAADALKLAIQFEKDSIIFYLLMQDLTEEDKGRESIGQLIDEEKEHLRTLSSQLRNLAECKK